MLCIFGAHFDTVLSLHHVRPPSYYSGLIVSGANYVFFCQIMGLVNRTIGMILLVTKKALQSLGINENLLQPLGLL